MIRRFANLGLARLLLAAVQAIALILVARLTGVAEFGTLAVQLTVLAFVFLVSSAGLPGFILRERALGDDAGVRAAARANIVTSSAAALLAIIVFLAVVPAEFVVAPVLLVVAVGVDKTVDCQVALLVADRRMRAVMASIIGRAVIIALVFGVALSLSGGADPVLSYVIARVVAALFSLVYYAAVRPRITVPAIPWRSFLRRVWPLAAANLIGSVRSLDAFLVFLVGGSAITGLYSAAVRPFAPASILAGSAGSVLMPHASTAEPGALARPVRRLRWVTILATVALVPFGFLGSAVAVLLYGSDYAAAGPALGVALVTVPAVLTGAILSTVLQSRGSERFVVRNALVSLPVFVAAVALGAALGGATGAAIGFAAAAWQRNVGLDVGVHRMIRREGAAAQAD